MKLRFPLHCLLLATGLTAIFLTTGCEWDNDDFSHNPPAGQGSIIVDNYTYTDIECFVDGLLVGKVNDDDDKAFDFTPGVYRVVLNDKDGYRSWADDVDVLEGRLTILTVRIGSNDYNDYNVVREVQ